MSWEEFAYLEMKRERERRKGNEFEKDRVEFALRCIVKTEIFSSVGFGGVGVVPISGAKHVVSTYLSPRATSGEGLVSCVVHPSLRVEVETDSGNDLIGKLDQL